MKKSLIKGLSTLMVAVSIAVSCAMPVSAAVRGNGIIGQTYRALKRDCVVEMACKLADGQFLCEELPYVKAMYGYDWCAKFAAFCVGDPNVFNDWEKSGSCTVMKNYYQSLGKVHSTPTRGDLVFYNRDVDDTMDHVGIVVNCGFNSDGSYWINTVEGNVNGSDCKNTRVGYFDHQDTSQVACFASPYDDSEYFTYIVGDVNSDGRVTLLDAVNLVRFIVGRHGGECAYLDGDLEANRFFYACDSNRDGTIDLTDLTYLKLYIIDI